MVLRDRTTAPAGAEIDVQYESANGWISGYPQVLPLLPKNSATLIEEVIFKPPVEGMVNKLTPLYARERTRGGPYGYSIYTSVIPSSDGLLLKKGEPVKISRREGDYYFLSTTKFQEVMVPVAVVDAPPGALSQGRVDPVPPFQAHLAASPPSPARSGQLYGKLKIPYRFMDKVLPEGSYLIIAYEAGEDWVLGGEVWQTAPRISKDAVDLVSRVDFDTPLVGRIKAPTTVYKSSPDVIENPTTLEQGEIFSNANPSIRVGDEVYIKAREGSDYIIEIAGRSSNNTGRVPVSVVDITTGDPASGGSVTIAPLPQSTNSSAAGYFRPRAPKADTDAWFTDYVVPFMVFSVLLAIAGAINRSRVNTSTVRPGEADYGVPHTNFTSTPDGFKVVFSRSSEGFYKATHGLKQMKGGSSPVAAIATIIAMTFGLFFILAWYGIESFRKTVIIVDQTSVKINGNTMSRSDFGNITVDHSLTNDAGEVAVLGYQFGRRTFPFGGVWDKGQAQEVASALNSHLRSTPLAGDEHNPSPEALRVARPTDF